MDITTNTTVVFTIQLTDQDVADILVDPVPFQQRLRAARGESAHTRAVRTGRKRKEIAIAPKAKAAGGRKQPEPKACPKCGQMFSPIGIKRHITACTRARIPASAN